MFGIGYSELLLIAVIGLVVIGPKDLPRVMRQVGRWVGKAQGMARHFRAGMDTMMREAELEEMEKKWRDENERIMREHPLLNSGLTSGLDSGAKMLPLSGPAAAPAEPAWDAAADLPHGPEPAAGIAPEPEAPPPEAPAPDPSAPELPLPAPAAPKRELP
jgi:sec-independent protein translocase protein TatB